MSTVFQKTALVLFFAALASIQSTAHARSAVTKVSEAASEVLMSTEFAQVSADLKEEARQNGKAVRISEITQTKPTRDNPHTIVTVAVYTKDAMDFTGGWSRTGEIVGFVQSSRMGELSVDGLYFKPSAEGPGGASVGNRAPNR